ncbi:MAG: transposase [Vicingaceae bacterium]
MEWVTNNLDSQKWVIHLKRNMLNKVASKHKAQLTEDLKEVFDMDNENDTIQFAFKRLKVFASKCKKSYRYIGNLT